MKIYGAIFTAVARKIKAMIAEYRKLVSGATEYEKKIFAKFEADAKAVLAEAEEKISVLENEFKAEIREIKNDLVKNISKL